ncbi:MAG: hypothetical protein OJF60_003135 [Burkholderiaceae bacterium]|jgi:general secretion pathway protein C|nr:MAG: hypothetical protein OJF60_003135 [Burkholderiaceae bacterium]
MPSNSRRNGWLHSVTFLVWALAAASVVFWALKLVVSPGARGVAAAAGFGAAAPDPQRVAQLLGAGAPAATAAAAGGSYALLGVVADPDGAGAALIAIDGRPAKPYRVGAPVHAGLLLQSVAPRKAVLAAAMDAPARLTLELPPLKQ